MKNQKPSEIFEGKDSSLKKAFDEATNPDEFQRGFELGHKDGFMHAIESDNQQIQ